MLLVTFEVAVSEALQTQLLSLALLVCFRKYALSGPRAVLYFASHNESKAQVGPDSVHFTLH